MSDRASPAAAVSRATPSLVDLSGRIALRVTLVVLGLLALVWLATQLASVLVVVFAALILAAGVLGPARWLQAHGLPKVAAVALTYLAVGVALVVGVLLVVVPLAGQIGQLVMNLPDLVSSALDRVRPVLQPMGVSLDGGSLAGWVGDQLQADGGSLPAIPLAVIGVVSSVISTIFLSILILIERNQARHWLLRFFAPEDRSTMDHLASTAADKLGGYVRGQLLIMTVTGTGSAIGLTLLGVPFALALGTLAFLTEAIPIAGPILAGAVMVGVALLESPAQALGTLVLVLALQQIEGLVLVPQIQGRVISISPAVALVSVIAGSTLAGIIGALIAIPLVAIVTVVVEEVVLPWRRRDIRSGPRSEDDTSAADAATAGESDGREAPPGDQGSPSEAPGSPDETARGAARAG